MSENFDNLLRLQKELMAHVEEMGKLLAERINAENTRQLGEFVLLKLLFRAVAEKDINLVEKLGHDLKLARIHMDRSEQARLAVDYAENMLRKLKD